MFGLSDSNVNKINKVFSHFDSVNKVIIYGSRAKGNNQKGSDIDLTLIGDKISHKELLHIHLELDDLLTPYQFDVSIFAQIENNDLLDHIKRMGKVFYQAKRSIVVPPLDDNSRQ
jgi:predicted nucleotidyltransferase